MMAQLTCIGSVSAYVGGVLSCFFLEQHSDGLGRKKSSVSLIMTRLVGAILQSVSKGDLLLVIDIGRFTERRVE